MCSLTFRTAEDDSSDPRLRSLRSRPGPSCMILSRSHTSISTSSARGESRGQLWAHAMYIVNSAVTSALLLLLPNTVIDDFAGDAFVERIGPQPVRQVRAQQATAVERLRAECRKQL